MNSTNYLSVKTDSCSVCFVRIKEMYIARTRWNKVPNTHTLLCYTAFDDNDE